MKQVMDVLYFGSMTCKVSCILEFSQSLKLDPFCSDIHFIKALGVSVAWGRPVG